MDDAKNKELLIVSFEYIFVFVVHIGPTEFKVIIIIRSTHMTYTLVQNVPANAEWEGDGRMFIQEGYVNTWGAQAPYGRNVIVSRYKLQSGAKVAVERYTVNRITAGQVHTDMKDAGY